MNFIFRFFLIITSIFAFLAAEAVPELIRPKIYNSASVQDISKYLVSEKLDGIRAYFDGKNLISRGGKILNAPKWFLENFPKFKLDGELWSKRGDFESIVSIVKGSDPLRWKELTFNVFEIPDATGNLQQRLEKLEKYLEILKKEKKFTYIKLIPQTTLKTHKDLDLMFQTIIGEGGEGLILRKKDEPYITGRSDSALKIKAYFDAECKIIGYKLNEEGNIKSIHCENILADKDSKSRTRFYISSGMTNSMRENPMKLDTIITYKFFGLTKNKKPRHPVFLRIREEF